MSCRIIGLTRRLEYLAAKSRLFYWIASHYYRNVIQKEIGLASITAHDHILCIGGGICPFSAILFHQISGAKVTVIDNCGECIRPAQQLIGRLGLDGYVNVIRQDGGEINFSLSDFSVVHFALQVFPMESVFPKVRKQVVPGTKLLIRRPKKSFDALYSQLPCSLSAHCRCVTHQRACNIGSTLLYVTQDRLNEDKRLEPQGIRPLGVRAADTCAAFPCPVAV